MTNTDIEAYVKNQFDLYALMNFDNDLTAHLETKESFLFEGVKCYISDEVIHGYVGIPPHIPYGIAYFPDDDCLVLNSATKDLPSELMNAVLHHEIGHRTLGHTDVDIELEMEADAYAQARCANMKSALIDMREKLYVQLSNEYPNQAISFEEIDTRIAAL